MKNVSPAVRSGLTPALRHRNREMMLTKKLSNQMYHVKIFTGFFTRILSDATANHYYSLWGPITFKYYQVTVFNILCCYNSRVLYFQILTWSHLDEIENWNWLENNSHFLPKFEQCPSNLAVKFRRSQAKELLFF